MFRISGLTAFVPTLTAAACFAWAALSVEAGSRPGKASDTRQVTFHPDRVYEVTGIWVEPGQMDALMAYFGEVFPIAAEDYGVTPLFSLEPESAYAGDFVPDIMFVNEWPSLDHFRKFVSDPRAKALFPRRDAAVSHLVVTQYEVPEATTVSLRDGDVVEFGGMWIKSGREQDLKAYYEEAFAIAKRHGIRPITPLKPVYSYRGRFLPSRAGLNLWGTKENFNRFVGEAAGLFGRRDASLDRLEVTHARVRFEGGL